jgi:hypothetical protein
LSGVPRLALALAGALDDIGWLRLGHQQVLAATGCRRPMRQHGIPELLCAKQDGGMFAADAVIGETVPDDEQALGDIGLSGLPLDDFLGRGGQCDAALEFDQQSVDREPCHRLAQLRFRRDVSLQQIDGRHDLDQRRRSSFRGKRRGQQEQCINIVNRRHGRALKIWCGEA